MLELQKEYADASREKLPRADTLARKIAEVDAMTARPALWALTRQSLCVGCMI